MSGQGQGQKAYPSGHDFIFGLAIAFKKEKRVQTPCGIDFKLSHLKEPGHANHRAEQQNKTRRDLILGGSLMVPVVGLEPTHLSVHDFESRSSAIPTHRRCS